MTQSPVPATRRPETRRPARTRGSAAILLALEALGLLVLASVVALQTGRDAQVGSSFTLGLALFLVVFAIGVGAAAVSVHRRGRFGVGFGITWQLFQALVSASLLRGALYLPGGLGLVSAVAAFVLLLNLSRETPTPLGRS